MSNSTPVGDSLTHKLTKLRFAAESIERLAANYHAARQPVREALQAVADVPLEDRGRWAEAVSALARRLSENGMADVPASLEGVERWDRQFDAGSPERAFAGRAFCTALAAAITNGSPSSGFFATLDQHSFITTPAATREVCAVLSRLLYVHTERITPGFTRGYGAILAEVGIDGETLRNRLAQCGMFLSSAAAAAVYDWNECSSGIPFYPVDIRPADCATANNKTERGEGETQPAVPAATTPRMPAVVRNWLTARYLADPTPGKLSGDAEPIVFVRYEVFADFLVDASIDLLPNLDDWKNAGWIEDVMVDLTTSPDPNTSPPHVVARLNLPMGRHRLVGIRRTILSAPTEPDQRNSEESGVMVELPTGKMPGVVSLNVLRATLEMLGFPDWRKRFESWPEVPSLRLRCAELFPGQPFSSATIELLIAWFQERGLTPDQARHLPLSEAVRRLSPQPNTGAGGGATGRAAEPPAQPDPSLLDQAKQFLAEKDREQEARQVALRLLPYILFPPNGPFSSSTRAAGTNLTSSEPPPAEATQGEAEKPAADRSKGIPLAEAEIRVRDWLAANAKDNPAAITRDAVAAGTGVSAGQVSKTAAWKAFRDRRDAETKPVSRDIPLSDQLEATVPAGSVGKAESEQRDAILNELIREQEAEEAEQERRHKRRHEPS